ncbi:MAG: hypothetical protein EPN69_02105 [Rhodanobacter sp.]|nr:MAG: hypothetical protein EPN69_02105 [Rhodanobacter sp.]TAM42216.1 MAG: hypothetical protein EPN58_03615 [Rhodanobacter sp.]
MSRPYPRGAMRLGAHPDTKRKILRRSVGDITDSLARLPGLATQQIDGQASAISIRGLSPDVAGTAEHMRL